MISLNASNVQAPLKLDHLLPFSLLGRRIQVSLRRGTLYMAVSNYCSVWWAGLIQCEMGGTVSFACIIKFVENRS